MSTNKHTPGPWNIGGTFMPDSLKPTQFVWGPTPEGMQSGEIICRDASPANARLIAAAPCLLSALQGLVDLADKSWWKCPQLDAARAAIQKAQP